MTMSDKDRSKHAWTSEYLAQRAVQWGTPKLERRVKVEFSSRMTRSLGRCYPARGLIRLAAGLLKEPRLLLEEVLCHEFAHIAVHELNGKRGRPHGPEWKKLMRKAGYEPRARLRWDGAPHTKRRKRRRYIYLHRCPVCQAERTARRAVRQWRCAACVEAGLDGELEIWRRQARFYERR